MSKSGLREKKNGWKKKRSGWAMNKKSGEATIIIILILASIPILMSIRSDFRMVRKQQRESLQTITE